jgi:hypothetical protein
VSAVFQVVSAVGLVLSLAIALVKLKTAVDRLREERWILSELWRDLRALLAMGWLERREPRRPRGTRLSVSQWLVDGAVRRLPKGLSDAERERWAEEMKADVASVGGRLKRLRCALRIWRRGAPEMPVGSPETPRSAD